MTLYGIAIMLQPRAGHPQAESKQHSSQPPAPSGPGNTPRPTASWLVSEIVWPAGVGR